MESQSKFYRNVSELISQARTQKGFSTLKEFYREKKPSINYQVWLHIESGRRIPATGILIEMGDLLDIPREDLIIAYCKDKFDDEKSHKILEAFQLKGLFDISALLHAKEYDRTNDYVITAEQFKAFQEDARLRLFHIYTYDREKNTTLSRLSNFFGLPKDECRKIIDRLRELGLVEVIGENVKKIHLHTTIPVTADSAELRKQILLRSLELTVHKDSYILNYHANVARNSYKRLLELFDFVEANLLKMEKEDLNDLSSFRIQIAMVGTKIDERKINENGRKST